MLHMITYIIQIRRRIWSYNNVLIVYTHSMSACDQRNAFGTQCSCTMLALFATAKRIWQTMGNRRMEPTLKNFVYIWSKRVFDLH